MSGLRLREHRRRGCEVGIRGVGRISKRGGKSEGLFHVRRSSQTSPGELVSTQEDKAIPERCRNLRHAARTEYSKCG